MTAYRMSAPICPTCHEALEPHAIAAPAAMVDLCRKCGGVWLDWEDGDMTELSRAVPAAAVREMPRSGLGHCPRCNSKLVVEVFLDTAEVLRCTDCSGAFVPYASIGKVAASTPAEARRDDGDDTGGQAAEAPADESADTLREGVWGRAVGSVRRWLKGE